jgi:hypothetical protein
MACRVGQAGHAAQSKSQTLVFFLRLYPRFWAIGAARTWFGCSVRCRPRTRPRTRRSAPPEELLVGDRTPPNSSLNPLCGRTDGRREGQSRTPKTFVRAPGADVQLTPLRECRTSKPRDPRIWGSCVASECRAPQPSEPPLVPHMLHCSRDIVISSTTILSTGLNITTGCHQHNHHQSPCFHQWALS